MNRFVVIILSLLLSFPLSAGVKRERPPFDLRKHEFALSGAVFPGRYAFGYDFDSEAAGHDAGYGSVAGLYDDARTYNKERVTDSWVLSYTYNFTDAFSLSAGLGYEGGWSEYYSRADDSKIRVAECHYITPMVTARFSWLNRNLVRMYSSAGAGVSVAFAKAYNVADGTGNAKSPQAHLSLQLTPVGISVGRDLFGFFEIGVGTVYVGGCLGIGYRF